MLQYIVSSLASVRTAVAAAAAATTTIAPAATSGPLHPEVQQWLVQWEDITPLRLIGRGSFGRVYLALWSGTPVACKVLLSADAEFSHEVLVLPEATTRELQKEAAVMARMRHPNIVAFMGLCTLPPCILTGEDGRQLPCAGGPPPSRIPAVGGSYPAARAAGWVQSIAAVARCTMCCAAAAMTRPRRRS